MLRALMLAMALAATPGVVSDAWAKSTPEQLELMKAEVEFAKDNYKAVSKLADDYAKNREKDKPNGEVKAELKSYYKAELARLRELGIETVDDPPPKTHPRHPEMVIPDAEEEDRDKMVALRDLLVELKKDELKDKPYETKLMEYVKILEQRANRKEKFYEKEKEESK